MAKHVVVEVHLKIDDSIQGPEAVAERAAERIKGFVDGLYDKEPRQVHTLVVSHRTLSVAGTTE